MQCHVELEQLQDDQHNTVVCKAPERTTTGSSTGNEPGTESFSRTEGEEASKKWGCMNFWTSVYIYEIR